MILLIDNYDSFTFNLYQYFGELGEKVVVIRNDEITLDEVAHMKPEMICLSPGPGRPEEAGQCISIIQEYYQTIPILGICLGHQAIGQAFGANITKAETIMHGKVSEITHIRKDIFASLPEPLEVMRYHSLVIDKSTLSKEFQVLAESVADSKVMAIKHKQYPVYGLQFHPESVGTTDGKQLIKNFLDEMRRKEKNENVSTASI